MPGYLECVNEAWPRQITENTNPFTKLHIRFSRTAKALRKLSKTLIPHIKIAMAVCREVIHQLETAQESRQLAHRETANKESEAQSSGTCNNTKK